MSQVYMTAKLNLADGTILYPQVSLDNIVASISDPTLVSVATTTNGKVPVAQLPTTLSVTDSNTTVPTAGAVYSALGTKQNTLVEGDNIIHIIDGSTIMADITNLDVAAIDQTATNGVHLVLDGGNTISAAATFVTGETAGVLAGVGDGIALSNGVISTDAGSGLKIGADTNAGKVVIDDASVESTLQDVRIDGASTVSPVDDQVVTPGNLRGALSVGQAVDVSCAPYNNSGSIVYVNDDFLQGFTATMVSGTTVGFYDTTTHRFPKFADGLVYLFIANVSGSGTVTPNGASAVTLSGTPQRIWTKVTASDSGYISASANVTMAVTNWRQYEVTALTDEAIAYIANLPDPDAFFRAASVYSLRDKYLVKQDMICPFIPTIGMPDNSDLTVASGLSYKIKYTNDNPHVITADTIPTDGYGWDTHVQMFIKGASSVVFQQPLILMDALTPNAGHNLVVKFRNGQALVYVDDLNAGYTVITATGSTTTEGSLAYALTYNPGADHTGDKYVMFAGSLDGVTCEFGTVTVPYSTDVIGNGKANTIIDGSLDVNPGSFLSIQDLSISGGTFAGAVTSTNVKATDGTTFVTIRDTNVYAYSPILDGVEIPAGSTVTYDNTANAVTGSLKAVMLNGRLNLAGSRLYMYYSYTIEGSGVLDLGTSGYITSTPTTDPVTAMISGVTITNQHGSGDYAPNFNVLDQASYTFSNCTFTGNVGFDYPCMRVVGSPVSFYDCVVTGNTATNSVFAFFAGAEILMHNMTLGVDQRVRLESTWADYTNVTVTGTLILQGRLMQYSSDGITKLHFGDNAYIDMTGNTNANPVQISGDVSFGNNVTIKSATGSVSTIDPCHYVYIIDNAGTLQGQSGQYITTTADTWKVNNAAFSTPIAAQQSSLVQLTGSTFTGTARIAIPPTKIQLLAGSTISFVGNSNAADTKILEAPVILVGDDAAAPSGSATVVNVEGTAITVSGIGTYVNKDGTNDFTTSITTVNTNATSGAGSLPAALTGSNKFVRIASNTVGTVGEATNAVDKTVMTNDYEPIIGGTFTLTSATVTEATKTTTILEGGTMHIVDVRGGKDSVIDLGGTFVLMESGRAVIDGCVISGGYNSSTNGGAFLLNGTPVFELKNAVVTSNNGAGRGAFALNQSAELYMSNTVMSGNRGVVGLEDLLVNGGCTCTLQGGCTVGNAGIGGSLVISGSNAITNVTSGYTAGTVTLTSGATLDLTGNTNTTPIAPGGGIIVADGDMTASCTIINSAGSAVALLGGTYSEIFNTGGAD